MAAEHLIVVGKGGVGKSTTAANLCAALAEAGQRVLLIGDDLHGNSTALLRGKGPLLPLPGWQGCVERPRFAAGYRDTLCIEAGDLAWEGDLAQARSLLQHPLVTGFGADYVVHDFSREPGSGLALSSAVEGVLRVLVVTSADMGALQVVNELFSWLNTVPAANCRFAGVVANNLSGPLYESIVSDFVSQTGSSLVANIPHSLMVSVSDFYHQTLIESAPSSHVSYAYRKLARSVLNPVEIRRPKYLEHDTLRRWALKWGEIITELETGVVRDGSTI